MGPVHRQAGDGHGSRPRRPRTGQTWDPSAYNSAAWWPLGLHANVYYTVNDTTPSKFTNFTTGFLPEGETTTITLGQQAAHGRVEVSPAGGFTYTPRHDPQTGRPYLGWDFFSYLYTDKWGGTLEQWVQLDVGNYTQPSAPRQPAQIRPQEFTNDLKGLWQSYNTSKARLADVYHALQAFGAAAKLVKQAQDAGDDPSEALQSDIDALLGDVNTKFDAYVQQVTKTTSAAGAYLKTVTFTSQSVTDIEYAIGKLPVSIVGIQATNEQLLKWKVALSNFGFGADWNVIQQNFNVVAAEKTHDLLEKACGRAG